MIVRPASTENWIYAEAANRIRKGLSLLTSSALSYHCQQFSKQWAGALILPEREPAVRPHRRC